MFLAENSISLIITSLLYVFNIEKPRDADGMALEPEVDYDGFIWYVFICPIQSIYLSTLFTPQAIRSLSGVEYPLNRDLRRH